MNTTHSILIASALFCSFMALGMQNAVGKTPGTVSPKESAPPKEIKADCHIVHDNNGIRLMLLLHNPSRGYLAKPCRTPQHSAHAEIGSNRGEAA